MALPSPKQLLQKYALSPKYSFGQNFLTDRNIARKIADLAAPETGLTIIEIGAGLGALTEHLIATGNEVIAIERDRDLVPVLEDIFAEQVSSGQLRVVEADAKTADWRALFGEVERPVIAGNLPYQITGPLIEKTIQHAAEIDRATFLVQKEVAERLSASPSTKAYGALSVFTQAQFEVKKALVIGGQAFVPPPRVDSAVVTFVPRASACDEDRVLQQVVKLAFGARRKTLRNAWKSLAPIDELQSVAAEVGFELSQRGETLSVDQFLEIAASFRRRRVGAE
ncbi:MAG: 16S rRNA (adenine(1518)-N(6)/adenine(1519)-N(6))-dimethyltransferase RsmA [Polyangiaceae bacterium]|nr:16S rRNA (adenine(1518)-N(6)/adenine(1519)-N(6))-dimethyltransferase RsmA [Polyangiaceae bacterium]